MSNQPNQRFNSVQPNLGPVNVIRQHMRPSEPCKRGYEVALTMGNRHVIDLMVVSPKGVPFLIGVKGQYKKKFWSVRLKKTRGKLFYVLAYVPDVAQNRFFILTQEGLEREIQRDLQHAIARRL